MDHHGPPHYILFSQGYPDMGCTSSTLLHVQRRGVQESTTFHIFLISWFMIHACWSSVQSYLLYLLQKAASPTTRASTLYNEGQQYVTNGFLSTWTPVGVDGNGSPTSLSFTSISTIDKLLEDTKTNTQTWSYRRYNSLLQYRQPSALLATYLISLQCFC